MKSDSDYIQISLIISLQLAPNRGAGNALTKLCNETHSSYEVAPAQSPWEFYFIFPTNIDTFILVFCSDDFVGDK